MTTKTRKTQTLRNNEYYGTQDMYDNLYQRSKSGFIFKNLLSHIKEESNVLLAFRNIKRNGGSETRGTNSTTIRDMEKLTTFQLVDMVRKKLSDYKPGAVRRLEIPKDNGGTRPLGIPDLEDRLIQQCIKQVLEPICEAKFHPHNYGFRPNRSQSHAISRAVSVVNMTGLHYVVDIDIKGFFDNVNHGKLIKQMWTMGIRDKSLICIISKMLKAEIKGIGIPTKGTPQGGILSPLLSNIVLNELDWWISDQWESFETIKEYKCNGNEAKARASKFANLKRASKLKECFIVRFADDFKIFCRNYEDAQRMFIATKQWLNERLSLEISPDKSKVVNLRKRKSNYLGFELKAKPKGGTRFNYVAHTRMSKKKRKDTYRKVRERITNIKKNRNQKSVSHFNSLVLGLHNYFKIGTHVSMDFSELDYKLRKVVHNRLKNKAVVNGPPSNSFKKLYKGYNGKTYTIDETTLFPIGYVQHQNPRNFKQETCNYTKEGRKLIHDNQKAVNPEMITYLVSNPIISRSIEYNDNRISLFVAQYGKCAITGNLLAIGNFECHHKVPISMGGKDEYKNLVIIETSVHKLIHATTPGTIGKYMNKIQLTMQQIKKINQLRKLVGNSDI